MAALMWLQKFRFGKFHSTTRPTHLRSPQFMKIYFRTFPVCLKMFNDERIFEDMELEYGSAAFNFFRRENDSQTTTITY